ncbi:thioredoxin H2-like [Diospyros lotus]|uniref:thioredoxin H2-like n=1 Tax=Diospyros lotus TaxID=55363 RepID=UPI0022527966|nr:thioredoxin H2-like [Diospyros lotus]
MARYSAIFPWQLQQGGVAAANGSPMLSVKASGHVLSFHSPAKWIAHFEASKASSKLMVIEFTASWCLPCRAMNSAIEEFAAKYTEADFIKMDVDEMMEVVSEFEVHILPTFILMKNGRVVDKVTGVKKEELEKKIKDNHRTPYYYN